MATSITHTEELLAQYRSLLPVYEKMAEVIPKRLKEFFTEAGIIVAAVEHRVKTEKSLEGKLKRKGDKYRDIFDVTDIVGIRVITFKLYVKHGIALVGNDLYFGILPRRSWARAGKSKQAGSIPAFRYDESLPWDPDAIVA